VGPSEGKRASGGTTDTGRVASPLALSGPRRRPRRGCLTDGPGTLPNDRPVAPTRPVTTWVGASLTEVRPHRGAGGTEAWHAANESPTVALGPRWSADNLDESLSMVTALDDGAVASTVDEPPTVATSRGPGGRDGLSCSVPSPHPSPGVPGASVVVVEASCGPRPVGV